MSRNVEIAQSLYAAFARGDVPFILSLLAPDVRWDDYARTDAQLAGVPALQPRRGRDGAAAFFAEIGQYRFERFDIRSFSAGPNTVAVQVDVTAVLPNGNRCEDEELHFWTFDEAGLVTGFRHYCDTARFIRVNGLQPVRD